MVFIFFTIISVFVILCFVFVFCLVLLGFFFLLPSIKEQAAEKLVKISRAELVYEML